MSVISYMGTKSALVDPINEVIGNSHNGVLLDLFAGMSAVGRSHENGRQVWLNDAQTFSKVVSNFQFRDVFDRQSVLANIDLLMRPKFELNMDALSVQYAWFLNRERKAISSGSGKKLSELELMLRNSYKHGAISNFGSNNSFDLFSRSHSGAYFSLTQAAEIDSIRYSISEVVVDRPELENWFLSALGRAMVKCSNSTGHFAQYLTYKPKIEHRFFLQRVKSIWDEWTKALVDVRQIGTTVWRSQNRVFNEDANTLLAKISSWKVKPGVIYADPPYTDDQYSRFYHILDTMVLYDFPKTSGKGQYREGRFRSNFSLRSLVEKEFEVLIKNAAKTGANLVISYPANGLLENSSIVIPQLMKEHFRQVSDPVTIGHKHSTLGASKGLEKHFVSEQIFLARN